MVLPQPAMQAPSADCDGANRSNAASAARLIHFMSWSFVLGSSGYPTVTHPNGVIISPSSSGIVVVMGHRSASDSTGDDRMARPAGTMMAG